LFDFGKSEIKLQSEAAFSEAAKQLEPNPLKVRVIVHTDIVGSVDPSSAPSAARAAAVVKTLAQKAIALNAAVAAWSR
jgi:outer membrane protein OmpA-like peptidoglycan-associated protein